MNATDEPSVDRSFSLALLEVANLAPALVVADRCLKAAGVRLLGIESTDSADQCIKLVGETGAVMAAGQAGVELARRMGASESPVTTVTLRGLGEDARRGLADLQIFVLDVSGGDKVPRKGGPGVSRSDLLVINKTDLAGQVGADLSVMARDADRVRSGRRVIFSSLREDPQASAVTAWVRAALAERATAS